MGSTLNACVEYATEVNFCCGSETLELAKKIAKRNEVELTHYAKRCEGPEADVFVEIEFTNKKSDTNTRARIKLD